MSDEPNALFYRLDKAERVIEVGGDWDRCALENEGGNLVGQAVIGRSLYDFINGDISRMFVRTVIDGVRILGRPRTVPYRCDSPGLRRYMEMTIRGEDGGSILVEHRQLRTESTGRKLDFTVALQPIRKMVVRCSHCNSVKIDGRWGEPEEVLPPEENGYVPVIYGVCERCLDLVRRR